MEVYAQEPVLRNPLKAESLEELLISFIDGVITILMPFLTLVLIYIGFRLVLAFSSGNSADYQYWKQVLLWTLLGLIIVLGAKGILLVIQDSISSIIR